MSALLSDAAIEACQGTTHLATLANFRVLIAPKAQYLVERLQVHAACHQGGTPELHESTARAAEELAALVSGLARYLRASAGARPGLETALVQTMADEVLECTK